MPHSRIDPSSEPKGEGNSDSIRTSDDDREMERESG